MTVSELIEKLQDFDGASEVHLSYDYGDHPNTKVAPPATGVDELEVHYSAYHRMDALVERSLLEDQDDEENEAPTPRMVVVIS